MSRIADRVYTAAADIARLEAIAVQLPQQQRVDVSLEGGQRVQGIVAATPTVQLFFDADGTEGMNGVVRIEAAPGDPRQQSFWLDQVVAVTALPNPSPPQASTRRHPVDPNAPAVD